MSEVSNVKLPAKDFLHKPFVIEIRQNRLQPSGSFIPAASLKLQEEFRTSGLLHSLTPDDLKSLLYLLTFVSPEGHCSVSLPILTSAMKVSSPKVKSRMHRLAQIQWQGEPLVVEVPRENGIFTYSLHPHLVAYEHLTISEQFPTPPLQAASRNRIVAYSRKHYARPRKEVERLVAAQLGQDFEETDEQRKLRYKLENVGLTTEQATETVLTYDADIIAQQLDWLPFRHAKNPAGYLLAAIEGGYGEPRGVREERIFRELRYGEQQIQRPEIEGPEPVEQGTKKGQGPMEHHAAEALVTGNASQDAATPGLEVATLAADGDSIDLTSQE